MSLKKFYQDVNLYRVSEGDFGTPSTTTLIQKFKGLVQTSTSRNAYVNNKDTAKIDGILFCDVSMNSVIQEGDLIEFGGIKYIVSGQASQPLGVSGIKPRRGQHCEFNLEYANRGI